jgi:hypothetical protein
MRRVKQLALVLMAFGLVTSAIYATGAFSDLTATRNANVAVTGDASGYLALRPASGPNGVYARYDANGQLRVALGGKTTGRGVNRDAVTTVKNVFTITNQGAQTVGLWLTDKSDAVTFKVDGQSIEEKGRAMTLKPGTTKTVSLVVDTRRVEKNTDLLQSVTFHASSTVSGTGAPAQGESGTGSKPAQSVPSTDDDRPSAPNTPSPPPKPKSSADDGFNPFNPGDYLEAGGNVIEAGGDLLNGITHWTRKQIMKKISYMTKQPIDALKSLSETAWNTILGFFVGEFGMPGGPYTAREAHSMFYLGGSMLSVFNPIADTAAGFRDFVAYLVKGDAIGMAIEAVGLFPVGGTSQDLMDIKSITQKWVKHYPNRATKMLQPLYDTFVKHIPSKSFRQTIVELFPGSAQRSLRRGDDAGSVASKTKKYPVEIKRLSKQDGLTGYTKNRMRRLVNEQQFTTRQIKGFAKRGTDLRMVEGLSKSGVSKAKITALTKTDTDLAVANRLSRRGFAGDQLVNLAKHGTDNSRRLPITLPKAEELMNAGYKPDQILSLSKASKWQNGAGRVRPEVVTVDRVISLRKKGLPADDVTFYVKNSYSLKMVTYLLEKGHSSKRLRKFLGSPEKVKKRVKTIRGAYDVSTTSGSIAYSIYGWCKMKDKQNESVALCPT